MNWTIVILKTKLLLHIEEKKNQLACGWFVSLLHHLQDLPSAIAK